MRLCIRDQMKNLHFFLYANFTKVIVNSWVYISVFSLGFFMNGCFNRGDRKNTIWIYGKSCLRFWRGVGKDAVNSHHCCISKSLRGLLGNKFQFASTAFHIILMELSFSVVRAESLGLYKFIGLFSCQRICLKERLSPLFIFHLIWFINQSTPLMMEVQWDLWLLYLPFEGISPKKSFSYLACIICFKRGVKFCNESPQPFVKQSKIYVLTLLIPSPPFSLGEVITAQLIRWMFFLSLEFFQKKLLQYFSMFLQTEFETLKIESW